MERCELPGTASIRAQIGIVQEDPRVFHPFTIEEAIRAADAISIDSTIPNPVRRLLRVGIALDLRPGHLTPTKSALGRALDLDRRTVAAREGLWECLDPILRADLVGRAAAMILLRRAQSNY